PPTPTHCPPPLQLPGAPPDPEKTAASPAAFKIPDPGTLIALPQVPFVSLTTNTWPRAEPSPYLPTAAQLPAVAHDTEEVLAFPPLFKAPRAGTSIAWPQEPFVLPTTNPW